MSEGFPARTARLQAPRGWSETGHDLSRLTATPGALAISNAPAHPGKINHVVKLPQHSERGLLDFSP
jgi:hypothetical protein